ncbi:hypothetical protein NQ176_g923 [Zarea fungicola]|uniref:Uncharacterized protein n=1 Tax=Zarea fungicola TaxID=93591 RepID=A0ACC1NVZ2_9HYPO|nr:hypothetical protein NQ176_g923 [Lecanicillium fungicola]
MENLAEPTTKERRRVRKGTHSCTESRGLDCVDQRDAPATFSRSKPKDTHHGPHSLFSGAKVPVHSRRPKSPGITNITQDIGLRPPFVSALSAPTTGTMSSQTIMESFSSLDSYHTTIRNWILSILPSRDEILGALSSNGDWWDSFQKKTRAISRASAIEPLRSFAIRVMDKGTPAELATLAIGYERSLDGDYARLAVIERLMMSSFELICTLEGLECIILLAKTYTDIGKPKRAWFTWRKGLSAAQFLGLHRLRPDAPETQWKIWWAIYHGDRFASLLLGLPHGGHDATLHEKSSSKNADSHRPDAWVASCVFDTCVIAGQVVDHNTAPDKLSYATAMKLEEQMSNIASTAPDHWWEVGTEIPPRASDADKLLDRILVQIFFLHVRIRADPVQQPPVF